MDRAYCTSTSEGRCRCNMPLPGLQSENVPPKLRWCQKYIGMPKKIVGAAAAKALGSLGNGQKSYVSYVNLYLLKINIKTFEK